MGQVRPRLQRSFAIEVVVNDVLVVGVLENLGEPFASARRGYFVAEDAVF